MVERLQNSRDHVWSTRYGLCLFYLGKYNGLNAITVQEGVPESVLISGIEPTKIRNKC